jgi:hypothetical protein
VLLRRIKVVGKKQYVAWCIPFDMLNQRDFFAGWKTSCVMYRGTEGIEKQKTRGCSLNDGVVQN